jgi:hypothetical protein
MALPSDDVSQLEGACHCGGVRFTVRLDGGLAAARRCTCSYCSMRGGVAISARVPDVDIIEGADLLSTYRFNTGTAQHHFCSKCGIYTHHQRRSNPDQYGINAACMGISPFDFAEVPVFDGQHHPSDTGGPTVLAGVLRFVRAT